MRGFLGWMSLVSGLLWALMDVDYGNVMGMLSLILAFVLFGTDDILDAIKERDA